MEKALADATRRKSLVACGTPAPRDLKRRLKATPNASTAPSSSTGVTPDAKRHLGVSNEGSTAASTIEDGDDNAGMDTQVDDTIPAELG